MNSPRVDLNSDLGESFGRYQLGEDAALLELVTSANVACGWHAGDPGIMRDTVAAALARGVAVGAHPGLPDLQGFGRRELRVSPQEAHDLTLYQIGALAAFVRAAGGRLGHVKPHGALYNMAARDAELAGAIAAAVKTFDPNLKLYGLSNSELTRAGEAAGLRVIHEVFADRAYTPAGHLAPRDQPGALLGREQAVRQALGMVTRAQMRTQVGSLIPIPLRADTICVHGDGPHALETARALRQALEARGVRVVAPD